MLLKLVAVVLLCHTFGQCCYPNVMSGQFSVQHRTYNFAINYTAGIAVSNGNKAPGYLVHFFPHGFYYSYSPTEDVCRKNQLVSYHQTTPAPIPSNAHKKTNADKTVTYTYEVNGRHDIITVTGSSPCHPIFGIYSYSKLPGPGSRVNFFNVKDSIDTAFFNRFLEDCKDLYASDFNLG